MQISQRSPMRLDELDYPLPKHLIAYEPAARRDQCRLLVVDRRRGTTAHRLFAELPQFLRPRDLVVLNDTRVLKARVRGRRRTGGRWEGLFLRQCADGVWELLLKSRGRLREGETLSLGEQGRWQLTLLERCGGGRWRARIDPPEPAVVVLEEIGEVPLPPYIKRPVQPDDERWYQTVFARRPGSVAAPTAGLHFTGEILDELAARGVRLAWVTLHVGPGTFRPIEAERIEDHRIHAEWCRVPEETVAAIRRTRAAGGRVLAVGTTVVRTLETAALGGELRPFEGETDLYIYPPFTFRVVDLLLTNFHLPKSTLLALVYAFGGRDLIRRAYEEAIAAGYRFYSYGDAMLIL